MDTGARVGSGAGTGAGSRARNELVGLLALVLVTLAASFATGKDVFVFAYIMTVVVAIGGPRRHGGAWADIGMKRGFVADLRRTWPLVALVAVGFQVVPPTVVLAWIAGFGPSVVEHIAGRLPVDLGSAAGLATIAMLLGLALVLTLVEELVFRAFLQDRLARSIGTGAAILVAAGLFGLAHAVGATGEPRIVLLDVGGVVVDGVLFGLVYARTRNLWLTWATHWAADLVGVIVLVTLFRGL